MQGELDAAGTPSPVRIHGVNAVGAEGGNAAICVGRTTPWLQDTSAQDAWGGWQVTNRDVVVLDELNQVVRIYNLTANSLTIQANYDELKAILTGFASD